MNKIRYPIRLELIADNADLSTKQLAQLESALAAKANRYLGDLIAALGGNDSYITVRRTK